MTDPKVVVVIISFNGERWIEACLRSILRNEYRNLVIVVVDNASKDATTKIARRIDKDLVIHKSKKNHGFGRGANIGIRYALSVKADYVLLLNQDIKLEDNCIENLVWACEQDGDIGIASPLQMNYGGTEIDPAFKNVLVSDRSKKNKNMPPDGLKKTQEINTTVGAAIFFRSEIFKVIGYFDPIFFLYHEEADLCRRAQFHGIQIHVVPDAKICHWHTQLRPDCMKFRSKLSSLYGYYFFILKDPFKSIKENLLSMIVIMYNWMTDEKNLMKILKRIIVNLIALPIVMAYLPMILIKRQSDIKRRDIF